MPGSEYRCSECGHLFRTPDGVPHDTRSLMCPACGSIYLDLIEVERPRPTVMRAREKAPSGDGVAHQTRQGRIGDACATRRGGRRSTLHEVWYARLMLRAVTFDFWSTLFVDAHGREREKLRAGILRDTLSAAGLETTDHMVSESLRASWDYFEAVWLHEHRTPPCAELVEAILASLAATLPQPVFDELVGRFERLVLELPPEPTPGAVYTMPQMAERYRLAIICDTGYAPGYVLRELLESITACSPTSTTRTSPTSTA